MAWKKDGYEIHRGVLNPDLCRVLAREFRMLRDTTYYLKKVDRRRKFAFNDEAVKNCFVWYSNLGFESLQEEILRPLVEKRIKDKVFSSYSYARIYYKGAEMQKHVDRLSCEISLSVCIDSDGTKWPLTLTDRSGRRLDVDQKPGDVLLYAGTELPHWREKYFGQEQVQAFFHFVRQKGKYRTYKYDLRPMLGLPVTKRGE
jgi:hypothetical protein